MRRPENVFRHVRTGRVLRVYLADDKTPVVDVVDTLSGSVFIGCRVLESLGGASRSSRMPIEPAPLDGVSSSEGAVVVLLFVSKKAVPVIIGAYPHKNVSSGLREGSSPLDASEEYPEGSDIEDIVIQQALSRLVISKHGDIVLDASKTSTSEAVRIQLPENARLRVSRGGEANAKLLLAEPVLSLLNQLIAKVNRLQKALEALPFDQTGVGPEYNPGPLLLW